MHQFQVVSLTEIAPNVLASFTDNGFIFCPQPEQLETRPDLLLLPASPEWTKETTAISRLQELLPKVILFIGHWQCPPELQASYDLHHVICPALTVTIATTLEGSFAEPDWDAYGRLGPLTERACLDAIAHSLYTFLLEAVISETAEWCGHMSSALRPW
ncbi:MAG: hypothetical protein E6713_11350 [Sporomusaceae bacterium]|nr:hypothetical protein [Sporomusaceae bacterium]